MSDTASKWQDHGWTIGGAAGGLALALTIGQLFWICPMLGSQPIFNVGQPAELCYPALMPALSTPQASVVLAVSGVSIGLAAGAMYDKVRKNRAG